MNIIYVTTNTASTINTFLIGYLYLMSGSLHIHIRPPMIVCTYIDVDHSMTQVARSQIANQVLSRQVLKEGKMLLWWKACFL